MFNSIIKELPQDYRPPARSLLDFYIDAFDVDTSYELRRAKTNDYKVAQVLAEEIEKDKKGYGKIEISGFDEGPSKSKESNESDDDPMQKLESMELNQTKLISNHAKEMSAMQARLVQMERSQAQSFQPRNNNNVWHKKGPSNEQRPPNPLEFANILDEAPPYCRACDALHEDATCHVVKRIIDSRMAGAGNQINVVGKEYHLPIEDHEHPQTIKDMQLNYTRMIQNIEVNQINFQNRIEAMEADHGKERTSMQNCLLVMRAKHAKEMETIKANHDKEMSSMQNCLMTIKTDNDKVIKNMEAGQICLQNKLLTMEENHAKEVSAMKVEHSNQMDAITIEKIILQNKLQVMEKIQIQGFQHGLEDERNRETSTDHKLLCLLQQAPSYYEEVICSIEKWLIEGDLDKREIDKNQVDAYVVDPPVITDQVHENKEAQVTEVLNIPNFPCERFLDQERSCAPTTSSSISHPNESKCIKRKRRRKRFDTSDSREQHNIGISSSPSIRRIGYGTSEKQPIDLPKSRQMLSMHYIEHI